MKLTAPIFRLKRQARLNARDANIPLHRALDAIAKEEGFSNWSHLSASCAKGGPAQRLLALLAPGDLVLLAARPGHGKTILSLDLAIAGVRAGRVAYVFSLEETAPRIAARLADLGYEDGGSGDRLVVDADDAICADYITGHIAGAGSGTLVVVDFMQSLDQRRDRPALAEQLDTLAEVARSSGAIFVMLSQIDRSFDLVDKRRPGLSDIRLPNPADLSIFTKGCFLHDGELEIVEMP